MISPGAVSDFTREARAMAPLAEMAGDPAEQAERRVAPMERVGGSGAKAVSVTARRLSLHVVGLMETSRWPSRAGAAGAAAETAAWCPEAGVAEVVRWNSARLES